jgi:hypothetical protein
MRLDGGDELLDEIDVFSSQGLLLYLSSFVERQMKVVDVVRLSPGREHHVEKKVGMRKKISKRTVAIISMLRGALVMSNNTRA